MIPVLLVGILGGQNPMEARSPSVSLHRLAERYWETYLEAHPMEATALGFRRFDHLLEDITPRGTTRRRSRWEKVRVRVEALDPNHLTREDRLTRLMLITQVESDLARLDCGLEDWVIDPLEGPQVAFSNIESFQPVRTVREGRAMIRRWRLMAPYLDAHIANLRRGLSEGKVAVREIVRKVIGQLEDFAALPDAEWTLLNPLGREHPDWTERDRAGFRDGLTRAVAESIRPALDRYRRFLQEEILPRARPQDRPGLLHLPGGLDCYRKLIRIHTSLDLSPEELHQIGLQEVARIRLAMERLGEKVLGTSDLKVILDRLRSDPALYYRTREELATKAESALAKAQASVGEWFSRLPKAACEVVRMPEHEEKHSTIAYYRQPAADGSRPGRYYVNTFRPKIRPRFQAEALAYHEAVPGHHFQLAIAQELTGLPEFRKHTGVTAFVEGWALYAERLADEMGLYSSDLDRMGMLSYEAWRACRLVVDTGMHAKGWTRQQAIRYLLENTALAETNVSNEVDRYITWPGQALAYKTGQLEILRLREEAREELGDRFDLRTFHDIILENGAVSLDLLRQMVGDYLLGPTAPSAPGAGGRGNRE